MKAKKTTRNKAIWQLLCRDARRERYVLLILVFSVLYALLSNLLTYCPPLHLPIPVLNIMASVDETLRNCCYGLIAGITFYLLNDLYKNVYKKVDLYNEMYPYLYKLWLKTYQLVLALNDHKLDESQTNEELHASIILNLCGPSEEEPSMRSTSEILASEVHLLNAFWPDILKDREKFLNVYGDIITREEYSKLNDKELDTSVERLKGYEPNNEEIISGMEITIRDYDIQRAIYLILNFKADLAAMVNKYSINYYNEERGIRKDAF